MVEVIKQRTHKSWHKLLIECYNKLEPNYQEFLKKGNYLPTNNRLFDAFAMPKDELKYILFGQDPYPREASAIGVAFIDGAVKEIFSQNGLSKEVNRATSLRNFIKMALLAEGLIKDSSQEAIASLDKRGLIDSIYELKSNFERSGVLLLNSALVFTDKYSSKYHIKIWQPFIKHLLENLNNDIELILFGNSAKDIKRKLIPKQPTIEMEHPYNVSFINSKTAHNLFGKMNLLKIYVR